VGNDVEVGSNRIEQDGPQDPFSITRRDTNRSRTARNHQRPVIGTERHRDISALACAGSTVGDGIDVAVSEGNGGAAMGDDEHPTTRPTARNDATAITTFADMRSPSVVEQQLRRAA